MVLAFGWVECIYDYKTPLHQILLLFASGVYLAVNVFLTTITSHPLLLPTNPNHLPPNKRKIQWSSLTDGGFAATQDIRTYPRTKGRGCCNAVRVSLQRAAWVEGPRGESESKREFASGRRLRSCRRTLFLC